MKKKSKLALTALLGSLVVGAGELARQNVDLYDTTIPVKTERGELDVPVYGILNQRPNLCSAYVRKAAEELFGKQYSFSSAWNRRYDDMLVTQVGETTLDDLVNQGILEPGMIVGVSNPNSDFKDTKDNTGNLAEYTHVVLYLGQGIEGEPLFADQYIAKTHIRTEKELRNAGLIPKEVIDSR